MLYLKAYAQLAGVVLVFGAILYALSTWHYKPLKLLERTNVTLKTDLIEHTRLLGICEVKIHKVNIDGFIEGIGEHNETIVIDFDNITY